MGFFKNILNDAAEELKKKAEEAKNQMIQNVKSQFDDLQSTINSANERSSFSSSVDSDSNDMEDDEPKICLGKFENGVLIISEGFTKLDDESMEDYKHVRKVIFPASLEELDEDVFSETEELEELDFSRVSKLKEIPANLVSCETKITELVIPQGVKKVGDGFLSEAKAGTKIFVPESVKQLGYINGNDDNDLYVYLFASGIDIDDVERDINTLYVLPKDYADYAEKLKDCDSDARIKEMPEEKMDFYSPYSPVPEGIVVPPEAKVTPAVEPASPTVNQNELIKVDSNLEPVTESSQSDNDGSDDTMFSQRLEALIKSAFQDGVLTQKEKEILIRRAEKEGEDPDEFEMLLNERISRLGITVIQEEVANPIVNPSVKVSKTNDSTFSDRLKNLIDNALEDGQLTEQERNAIIRRAQAENEDIDEVDIYIQSLQQKRLKELKDEAQQKAEKERVASMKAREAREKAEAEDEKERSTILRKCPACGATLPPLTSVCPECGIIIDAFNIDKEIITLIQTVQRADFTIKDGAIAGYWTYVPKSSFDNDPVMKGAYRIKGENYNGTEYEVISNYVELMNQLRMLYSDNPKVKNFLAMQRNVEYNKIIAYGKDCIKKSKNCYERGGSWKDTCLSWKNNAYGAINLLKQYNDMPNYARDIKEMEELYDEIKDYPKSTFSRLFGR